MIRKVDFHETSTLKYIYCILYQLDGTDRINSIPSIKSFEEFMTYSDGVFIHIDDIYEKSECPKINAILCVKRCNPSGKSAQYNIDILYIASWVNSDDACKILYELINTALYDKKDLPAFIWITKPIKLETGAALDACNFKIRHEGANARLYYRFVE